MLQKWIVCLERKCDKGFFGQITISILSQSRRIVKISGKEMAYVTVFFNH